MICLKFSFDSLMAYILLFFCFPIQSEPLNPPILAIHRHAELMPYVRSATVLDLVHVCRTISVTHTLDADRNVYRTPIATSSEHA